MILIDFDPTSLNTEINGIKTAVFGTTGTISSYPPMWDDTLDGMRSRLRNIESMVITGGDPLILVKQKVSEMYNDLSWVKSLVMSHDCTLHKLKDADMTNIKEIATQLKSIVENLNGIVSDPKFQNELERMNELINRIGD